MNRNRIFFAIDYKILQRLYMSTNRLMLITVLAGSENAPLRVTANPVTKIERVRKHW